MASSSGTTATTSIEAPPIFCFRHRSATPHLAQARLHGFFAEILGLPTGGVMVSGTAAAAAGVVAAARRVSSRDDVDPLAL